MSEIDKATVAKIARLSRIKIAEEKQDAIAGELNNILGWIEQLNEVNTDGVEPMASVVDTKLKWRKDEITDGDKQGIFSPEGQWISGEIRVSDPQLCVWITNIPTEASESDSHLAQS